MHKLSLNDKARFTFGGMTSWIVAYLWLLPLLPLAAAFLILGLTSGKRWPCAAIAIVGQASALAMSVVAFYHAASVPGFRAFHNFTWFTFGQEPLRLGWMLDPLTAVMLAMITFVALCIFIFSVGYMSTDKNFSRFFAYLSFFTAAMLGVVIANSLLLLFICWELVGLASYLLIGFWIHKPSAAAAAKKAFITTRIGDIGFFLGLLWIYQRAGTLLFYDQGRGILETAGLNSLGAAGTLIALLIFCGAAGKSGQFPLHVWLPDAMEGPTPVSALIHAATMVAAGVFLVARTYPVFSLGQINGVTSSLTIVVWIGVITALMAALIACAQFDIKRILAYSTVSQLGLMMVSLGVGGVAAGIVHLIAHGFFKALLFLGAGSVIHGCREEQDVRQMGGLRKVMPVTFATYAIGMMALSGVPLFFSGGWSKEEILHATSLWPASRAPHFLMLAGVILTAFYMTRQIIFVFFGEPRSGAAHARESPRVMTAPLAVLASCAIVLSIVLTPAWPWLYRFLEGEPATANFSQLIQPGLFVSLALVAAGIGIGSLIYRRASVADPFEQKLPAFFGFLAHKMWIDDFYNATIIALARGAARAADLLDRYFLDGFVRLFGGTGRSLGNLTSGFDRRGINLGVDRAAESARGLGQLLSARHSGQIQNYLAVIAVAMLTLLLLYAWLI